MSKLTEDTLRNTSFHGLPENMCSEQHVLLLAQATGGQRSTGLSAGLTQRRRPRSRKPKGRQNRVASGGRGLHARCRSPLGAFLAGDALTNSRSWKTTSVA